MKTHAFLATSLVAFLTACGTTGEVSLNEALDAGVTDARNADAMTTDAKVSVTDASDADASSRDVSVVPVILISAGYLHTCAILNDNSVKCWGYNIEGQLGLGDFNSRGDDANEMGDKLPKVDLGAK